MTDSIPQQAGQLAVVPQHTYDALVQELTNIAQADPSKWDPEMRGEFRSWAQSRARFALSHLAAPLAVEDSRERCASSDARPLLDPAFPREGYVSDAEWAARQRGATQGDIYATRLRAVLEVVQRFLSPDGIDAEAAMGEIVGLVDPWPAAMAAASSGKEKME